MTTCYVHYVTTDAGLQVVDLLGQRKGHMVDMQSAETGPNRVTYRIPTRGLLGVRNALLTATKGTAVLNTIFKEYAPWCDCLSPALMQTRNGNLLST